MAPVPTPACSAYPLPPSGAMDTVISWDDVRCCAARTPRELTIAIDSVVVENEPYAMTPASSAAAITSRTAPARISGVAPAVSSENAAGTSTIGVGSGSPAQSGSSSTLRLMTAACWAIRRRPSSSSRPPDATPIFLPEPNRRLICAFVADCVARAPEFVSDSGVRRVLEQPPLLAALDLVGDLGRELEVQAAIVDRPAPVGCQIQPVIGVLDDLGQAHPGSRQQVDVGHPDQRDAIPSVGAHRADGPPADARGGLP